MNERKSNPSKWCLSSHQQKVLTCVLLLWSRTPGHEILRRLKTLPTMRCGIWPNLLKRFRTLPHSLLRLDGCGQLPMTRAKSLRSEEHTSELQSRFDLVCRLLLEKKKNNSPTSH